MQGTARTVRSSGQRARPSFTGGGDLSGSHSSVSGPWHDGPVSTTQTLQSADDAPAEAPTAGQGLSGFDEATRAWVTDSFASPTAVQEAAWQSISSGAHTLLVAPTGSGKTLAAFLHSLDRLAHRPRPDPAKVQVLYISPLKALAVDVDRNLTAPLRGIGHAAARLGRPMSELTVGVRTGDTPQAERRRQAVHPPDILITTPESLFLMLSSAAASTLDQLECVIIDEIHALAGTKRGAHLMLSLERLDHARTLSGRATGEVQRIGLSATVRPLTAVATFLGGDRPVQMVAPPAAKQWELSVQVPVADMTQLRSAAAGADTDEAPTQSIWPHLEQRALELIDDHHTTLCFVNSRRVAERVTAHLNERHAERLGFQVEHAANPAQMMAQSGASGGIVSDDPESVTIARAHHGSVSKDRRAQIESDLKSGQLRCVVATSSLELGIDMGLVDQVIQIGAPPSVASGLQRVGRAGHQVGASSEGIFLPIHRHDLVESAVVTDRMQSGQIEQVHELRNPLDVLAQQLVSLCVDSTITSREAFALVRRSAPFAGLPESLFDATVEMLTGRYPSEDWAELRPRLVWDRATDHLSARPGARRLVTTSGGTIPDRGLFGVFLAGEGEGRRVGELDEEMVYESRVGDVFTLGTSSWRIEEITAHQVLVTPAPGVPGRLPFWHGDAASRPLELGRAIGDFVDQVVADSPDADRLLERSGLDDHARTNLRSYLSEQQQATGVVPGARQIVVERCRDELGDWRVLVHAAWGSAVLSPLALVIEAKAQERYGVQARATATNDGIILRIPDLDDLPPGAELLDIDPAGVREAVIDQVFGSALFAARFRECSARALLLPRKDPGRRSPLWQQRMRSAQLLAVASTYPDFPIVLETMRECLEDVFDLDGLVEQLTQIASRAIRVVEVSTEQPSPFARSLLFSYVGEFVYEADQPLAERVLAAAAVDPDLLAELLSTGQVGADLLDPLAADLVEQQLQRTGEHHRAETPESLWDVVRTLGPLTTQELVLRCADPQAETWIDQLAQTGRLAPVRITGVAMWAVPEDLELLRDGLGVSIPPGFGAGPVTDRDPALSRLLVRWIRSHAGTTITQLATRYGLPPELVAQLLTSHADRDLQQIEDQWWHSRVIQAVRRKALARLRSEVEPSQSAALARFAPLWQDVAEPLSGADALLGAVEGLAGYPIPASMLESVVLPARVSDYQPAWLDDLLARGEVVWTGAGSLGSADGWIQLWPADLVLTAPLDLPELPAELDQVRSALLQKLDAGGAWTLDELSGQRAGGDEEDALWSLVWSGRVTCNTMAAVRELSTQGMLKQPKAPQVRHRRIARVPRLAVRGTVPGRWSRVWPSTTNPTEAGLVAASVLLARHGVLTRPAVQSESLFGSFSAAYRVLSAMEESGGVRRGYFVEGLGAAQFALPGAVDRLRSLDRSDLAEDASAADAPVLLLAACDPANPFGAALPWPQSPGHRPARKSGALVVIRDGELLAYCERGLRSLLIFTQDHQLSITALTRLREGITGLKLPSITVEKVNGQLALGDPQWGELLQQAGFAMTPQGFRARRGH